MNGVGGSGGLGGMGVGGGSDHLMDHGGHVTTHLNMSDDDDDDMPSSPGSFDDDNDSYQGDDGVSAQLAAAGGWSTGPVGVAAAAAIASAKKRKRHHSFELNPSIRKRQQTRLLRKLKATIDEYSTRVGQQAVVVVATPSKSGNNFKCFGAKPLEDVMKTLRQMVMTELENALAQQAPPQPPDDPSLHELPPLVIDGIPTPVEKMTQAQLRAFIPLMLKFSTGRGKPGWGKESTRPPWWPKDVPWANVRMDARTEDMKQKISWTTALRQIVINCYKYHGRDDLLPAFNEEEDKTQTVMSQVNPVYSGPVVQTISNPDGTVSIIQVDPSNPVIQLPDGTTAHVQGVAHNGESMDGDNGSVAIDLNHFTDGQVGQEGTIILTGEDGSQTACRIITGGSNFNLADLSNYGQALSGHKQNDEGSRNCMSVSGAYPVSGMITVPLPVYQTVVANIQGADGQPLQVVTPIVQDYQDFQDRFTASLVPKIEPGIDGGVEVSAGLNASLDASNMITHHTAQDDDDDGSIDMVEKE